MINKPIAICEYLFASDHRISVNYFYKIAKIFILIILLHACGEGCKYPEDESLGDLTSMDLLTVLPINKDVVNATTGLLVDGKTENDAKSNLWVSPQKTVNGREIDVMVRYGSTLKIIVDKKTGASLNGLFDQVIVKQEKVGGKNGYFINSNGKVGFRNDATGIMPIKFSKIKLTPGQSIPIKIAPILPSVARDNAVTAQSQSSSSSSSTTSSSTTSGVTIVNNAMHPLVQSVGCNPTTTNAFRPCNKYIELKNGHGLFITLTPQKQDAIPYSANYSNPDLWQCNTFTAGSHGWYQDHMVSSGSIPVFGSWANNIYDSSLKYDTATCTNEHRIWFSGTEPYGYNNPYDASISDTGAYKSSPFYHQYDLSNINSASTKFLCEDGSDTACTTTNPKIKIYQNEHDDYMLPAGQDAQGNELIISRLGPFSGFMTSGVQYINPIFVDAKIFPYQQDVPFTEIKRGDNGNTINFSDLIVKFTIGGPGGGWTSYVENSVTPFLVNSFYDSVGISNSGYQYWLPLEMHNYSITPCKDLSSCAYLSDYTSNVSDKTSTGHVSLGRTPYALTSQINGAPIFADKTSFPSRIEYAKNTNGIQLWYPGITLQSTLFRFLGYDNAQSTYSNVDAGAFSLDMVRCTGDWRTPRWMLMSDNSNPSTFLTGFDGLSGTYFSTPDQQSESISDISNKYRLADMYARYGGLVNGAIFKVNKVNAANTVLNAPDSVKRFSPKFKTIYDKQIILVKNIIHDPINAEDTECPITLSTNGTTSIYQMQMNEPYKNNSTLKNGGIDPGVYLKNTGFLRRLISSGSVHADWHQIGGIINKDSNIEIYSDPNKFFSASEGLCLYNRNACFEGPANLIYQFFSQLLTGPNALTLMQGGISAITGAAKGVLPAIVNIGNPSGMGFGSSGNFCTDNSTHGYTRRRCGTAVAFRVLPVPEMICKKGFRMKCSNDRINDYINSSSSSYNYDNDYYVDQYCQSSSTTSGITLGSCIRKTTTNVIPSGAPKLTSPQTQVDIIQKYSNGTVKINNLVDQSGNTWSMDENIQNQHCGLCVPTDSYIKNQYYTYIDKSALSGVMLPTEITDSSTCQSYVDENGVKNKYTWLTQYIGANFIPPSDIKSYIINEYFKLYDNDGTIYDPNSYIDNDQYVNDAWKNSVSQDPSKCSSTILSLYTRYTVSITDKVVLKDKLTTKILSDTAVSVCNYLNTVVNSDTSANTLTVLEFNQNTSYASCIDDKSIVQKSNGSYSAASADSGLLTYGLGELTNIDGSGTGSYTLKVPEILKSDTGETTFKLTDIGFGLLPTGLDNNNAQVTDVMKQYQQYKTDSTYDISRGYSITIGDGSVVRNGKYLYYYIQPLDKKGVPIPEYNPNTFFSPAKTTFSTKHADLIKRKDIYSFYDYSNLDGTLTLRDSVPRTGKLWLAILDPYEEREDGSKLNKYPDADGKAIVFMNDSDTTVTGNNYLSYNNGGYDVNAYIQTTVQSDSTFSSIKAAIASATGLPNTNNLFNMLIIAPCKIILFGKWNDDKQDYQWNEGLVYKIGTLFSKNATLQTAYYIIIVVVCVIIGAGIMFGTVKLKVSDLKDYAFKYAIIATFISPAGWNLYQTFVVKASINFVEGLSSLVAGNFVSGAFMTQTSSTFIDAAFGPMDEIMGFLFKGTTWERASALILSSWTGFAVFAAVVVGFIGFLIAGLGAVINYVIILITMAMYLCIGPMIFITLVHDKTKGIFDKWWKKIAALISEQVFLCVAISLFSTIYLSIVKTILNFTICWESMITIPFFGITIFSWWNVVDDMPAEMRRLMGVNAPSVHGAEAVNISQALVLILLVILFFKFVDKAGALGAQLFGEKPTGGIMNTLQTGMQLGGKAVQAFKDRGKKDEPPSGGGK